MMILHLDDQLSSPLALKRAMVRSATEPLDYRIIHLVKDLNAALAEQDTSDPDLIVIDYDLGHLQPNGVEVLSALRHQGIQHPIVILSGHEDPRLMSLAIQQGSNGFFSKADPLDNLISSMLNTIQRHRREGESPRHKPALAGHPSIAGDTMVTLAQRLRKVVERRVSPLLVRGESGTGKEQVANLIEAIVAEGAKSLGSSVPFVRVNCSSLQDETVESELFGHERGAFTGAERSKTGLFETAHRGWIFLDEVAKLSARAQASLLRALESGEIRPLGATATKTLDVRVIAATNEDLDALSLAGAFRSDLLERLRVYTVTLPPLRERSTQERQTILNFLVGKLTKNLGCNTSLRIDAAANKVMLAAQFRRSNIREMWNALQSAAVESEDGTITVASLPKRLLAELIATESNAAQPLDQPKADGGTAQSPGIKAPNFEFCGSLLENASSYQTLELQFFADVLRALTTQSPEHTRSIRSIAARLQMGRHLASRKLRDLRTAGLLPAGLGHLMTTTE